MKTGMFSLSLSDWQKAFVMAILGGLFLPIAAVVQTPNFSIANVNLHALLILGVNGAIVTGVGYIVKNFFSDSTGAVFGMIGKTYVPPTT